MGNWLAPLFCLASSAPALPPGGGGAAPAAPALPRLREMRRVMAARSDGKRREIRALNAELVERGLRMTARGGGGGFSPEDVVECQRVLRHKHVLTTAHRRYQALLGALDEHVHALTEAPALAETLSALAGSVTEQAPRLAAQLAAVRAAAAAIDAPIVASEQAVVEEHDPAAAVRALLEDAAVMRELAPAELAAFLGHFTPEEQARVRSQVHALAAAPAPPRAAPGRAAAAAALLA